MASKNLGPRSQNSCGMRARLVLAVAALMLFAVCSRTTIEAPSRMGRSQQELRNPVLAVSGIYDDGWIASSASVQLTQPPGSTVLHVRGMEPLTDDAAFRTVLELRLGDEPIARRSLGLGDFDVFIPVPEGPRPRHVTLAFDRTQILPAGDGRRVGARLESLGFEAPDPARALPAAEIVDDLHVRLGAGWGKLQTLGGETFRWAENDAELLLDLGRAQDAVVTMLLEPGPRSGGRPLLLRVLDESGRQAGAIVLDRRGTFRQPLPLKGGKAQVFHLRIEGGGTTAANDSPAMSFRALAIEAEPWPAGPVVPRPVVPRP